MATQSIIDVQFTDAFNEAKALYDADRLDECIAKARELLEDPAIPRYHQIKTLILLGSTLGEWSDANSCLVDAEALWALTRRWHPEGEDKDVDIFMAEIRTSLDELAGVLREEEPEDYDMDDAIEEVLHEHDEQVADAQMMMEDLDLDQDSHEETGKIPQSGAVEVDTKARRPPQLNISANVEDRRPQNRQPRQPAPDSPAMASNNWWHRTPASGQLRHQPSLRDLAGQRGPGQLRAQPSLRDLAGQRGPGQLRAQPSLRDLAGQRGPGQLRAQPSLRDLSSDWRDLNYPHPRSED
ncbi:hypothetical protein HBH81_121990 [Parastagonospora nodorum]|nr:hypothetical protein HBH81_121990 [Parastagonospora nodorum]KAH5985686.1 hypothetical protein HBI84_223660 [Parastagonospora nodorum]